MRKNPILHIDLPYLPINVINFGGLKVSWRMELKCSFENRTSIETRDKS
jgi:hypothetical protein